MAEILVAIERAASYDVYQCTVPVEQIDQTVAALHRETADEVPCTRCESVASLDRVRSSIEPLIHDCAVFIGVDGSQQQFCVVALAVDPTTPANGSDGTRGEGILVQPDSTGLGGLYYRIQGVRSGLLEAAATTGVAPETFTEAFRLAVADWGGRTVALAALDDETF